MHHGFGYRNESLLKRDLNQCWVAAENCGNLLYVKFFQYFRWFQKKGNKGCLFVLLLLSLHNIRFLVIKCQTMTGFQLSRNLNKKRTKCEVTSYEVSTLNVLWTVICLLLAQQNGFNARIFCKPGQNCDPDLLSPFFVDKYFKDWHN